MEILCYTVEDSFRNDLGLSIGRGIRMSEISQRSELKNMIQGISLELRFPDGTTQKTTLVNYGVSVYKQADGSFLREEDPYLRFILPADLEDIPVGTEIWWIRD